MSDIDNFFEKLSAYSQMKEPITIDGVEADFLSWVQPIISKLEKKAEVENEKNNWIASLRHLFYQETKERYKAEGRMTDAQIERELSESMGHSRNDVNNTYSNEIKRIH